MAKNENDYKRLPGRNAFRPNRLYLGRDHLLRVNSNGWTEQYRRFYFSDIRALIITRNRTGMIQNIVLACIAIPLLGWCLAESDKDGRVVLGVLSGFFWLILGINALMGPTCRASIYTPLGSEVLPSVKRMPTGRKLLKRLKPAVIGVQGELNAAEIPAMLEQTRISEFAAQEKIPGSPGTVTGYDGLFHVWMFCMMIAVAGIAGLEISSKSVWVTVAAFLSGFVLAGLTIVSLVKQQNSSLDDRVRKLTWCALGFVIAGFITGYAMMIYAATIHPQAFSRVNNDTLVAFHMVSQIHVSGNSWLTAIFSILIGSAFIIGISGLILTVSSRANSRSVQTEPPAA